MNRCIYEVIGLVYLIYCIIICQDTVYPPPSTAKWCRPLVPRCNGQIKAPEFVTSQGRRCIDTPGVSHDIWWCYFAKVTQCGGWNIVDPLEQMIRWLQGFISMRKYIWPLFEWNLLKRSNSKRLESYYGVTWQLLHQKRNQWCFMLVVGGDEAGCYDVVCQPHNVIWDIKTKYY